MKSEAELMKEIFTRFNKPRARELLIFKLLHWQTFGDYFSDTSDKTKSRGLNSSFEDSVFQSEITDVASFKKVAEFVRNPIIFSEEYFDQGKNRNFEQDEDLKNAFEAINKKKLQQLKTLQQLMSSLDDKVIEDKVARHQQRVLGELLQDILNQIPALKEDSKGRKLPVQEIDLQLLNLLNLLRATQIEKVNDNQSLGEYIDPKSEPIEVVSRVARYVQLSQVYQSKIQEKEKDQKEEDPLELIKKVVKSQRDLAQNQLKGP